MTYYLDKAEWPTIPVPHDCVINDISFSDDFLVLTFEQDISIHDFIQHIHSNAKVSFMAFPPYVFSID